MSQIEVSGCVGMIQNACVYDMPESIAASKYPMKTDTIDATKVVTETVCKLAKKPSQTGEDNFLSGIVVAFDLTLTNKAWIEFERYHHAQIVSSQSTMHKLSSFDLDRVYSEHVDPAIIDRMKALQAAYNADKSTENYLRLIYSNPAGMRLTARITTNYRQLKTIYRQRRNHRLPEWRRFCKWIEDELPHSEWITDEIDKQDGENV